ncbi:hypothetical protein H0H81_012197 [Sphagnurus paluster]|uniref:MYND-type domain-containing protein n=1 Tax=Sphagnurus paluster TaxID=117069 RepID=A0A9P7K258_9AGAR|nr:hypothetical protein H0H81_012197 [Sphagnurus paluster]
MRESNFAFPTQNKACVCITSQLYDRRALDTSSPLPLLNSLTHLTYLTSTSPRIREIMTMDGGLERLVHILHDFCLCPPPPENGAVLYGLIPPTAHPPRPVPTLNPPTFDKQAAYRFSLAFQCVVNIGVRGSEPIRSRVVQAGTLEVVGCILEAWLANKGFAVGPSSSATGLPRETREQRQARRDAHLAQRQRDQQAELERQRNRQPAPQRGPRPPTLRLPGQFEEDESMDVSSAADTSANLHDALLLLSASTPATTPNGPLTSGSDTDMSTDASAAPTPSGSGTPTGTVVVPTPVRDRSGTVIARPSWDPTPLSPHRRQEREDSPTDEGSSRPETETEDEVDADGDVMMERAGPSTTRSRRRGTVVASTAAAHLQAQAGGSGGAGGTNGLDSDTSPERQPPSLAQHRLSLTHTHARRAVGIVSDQPADAHIIISEAGDVGEGVAVGVGVEDGIVSLEANDDFAMGAPPGAPGAITVVGGLGGGESEGEGPSEPEPVRPGPTRGAAPDETPRAGVIGLPPAGASTANLVSTAVSRTQIAPPRPPAPGPEPRQQPQPAAPGLQAGLGPAGTAQGQHRHRHHHHHHHHEQQGPYRDEDVLLSLQLLAYLSKYPHVRQAFYKPRVTFHPASVDVVGGRWGARPEVVTPAAATKARTGKERESAPPTATVKESSAASFFRSLGAAGRGALKPSSQAEKKEKEKQKESPPTPSQKRQTNVFSLVERFTFKPSATETDLPNPPPRLPPEIQYWAGVVMRNACRKDDSRGGIRQCANMLCGRWESYPREFAKCRRCRKAKYCGKECQSTAWSEGHRFWCSVKDDDEAAANAAAEAVGMAVVGAMAGTGATGTADATQVRRDRRERERERARERTGTATAQAPVIPSPAVGPPVIPGPSPGPSRAPVIPGAIEAWPSNQTVVPRFPSRTHNNVVIPQQQPPQQQQPIGTRPVASPSRPLPPAAGYTAYESFTDGGISGRRRAETVTGAPILGALGSMPNTQYAHGRLPQPPPRSFAAAVNPLQQQPSSQYVTPHYSMGTPSRVAVDAGPSRRRRAQDSPGPSPVAGSTAFRSPVEENDMILG